MCFAFHFVTKVSLHLMNLMPVALNEPFTPQRWCVMTKSDETGFYALIRERKKKERMEKTDDKKNAHPSISNYVKLFTRLTIVTRISHFYCQKLMLLLYIMLPLFKVKSFSSLTICDSKKRRKFGFTPIFRNFIAYLAHVVSICFSFVSQSKISTHLGQYLILVVLRGRLPLRNRKQNQKTQLRIECKQWFSFCTYAKWFSLSLDKMYSLNEILHT